MPYIACTRPDSPLNLTAFICLCPPSLVLCPLPSPHLPIRHRQGARQRHAISTGKNEKREKGLKRRQQAANGRTIQGSFKGISKGVLRPLQRPYNAVARPLQTRRAHALCHAPLRYFTSPPLPFHAFSKNLPFRCSPSPKFSPSATRRSDYGT